MKLTSALLRSVTLHQDDDETEFLSSSGPVYQCADSCLVSQAVVSTSRPLSFSHHPSLVLSNNKKKKNEHLLEQLSAASLPHLGRPHRRFPKKNVLVCRTPNQGFCRLRWGCFSIEGRRIGGGDGASARVSDCDLRNPCFWRVCDDARRTTKNVENEMEELNMETLIRGNVVLGC